MSIPMRIKSITIATVATAAVAVLAAPSAQAAGQDGSINNNEFIFYYNSNYAGSFSDFTAGKSNLLGYTYLASGLAGYGQSVKNNAASVANLRGDAARVYYNSGYQGAFDHVGAESSRNLANTYNENASFRWL